ncbi:b(o/a)3-type cytochrome-c oxidase subunit 1 [Halonotius pteroides]|uniref:Cytochrome C oxidase subunit I n=1 Tax=Halonotius pteroides TaxID=268735 RepID=A0A3A6QBH4_9EURY|nr:b(o/a)3-type cytochrome-c oxidase subunit 1 [Halonotius pteroides]RJX49905.1 cytochrome C oxidase subunit I [Halonotius pteroides]
MGSALETGTPSFVDRFPQEASVVKAALTSSFIALFLGAVFGLIQGLHRTDVFRFLDSQYYYTVLTAHGVLMVVSFTIFFLVGIFTWAVVRSLDRPVEDIRYTWAWYGLMVVGTLMAVVAILGGFVPSTELSADVLYTFYAPLQAHPLFYGGLAIFIIGTWLAGADWFRSWYAWKQEHPDERIPLQTFMVLTTMLMWYIATIGIAIAVVGFLLPWSLGLIESVNPLLTRTLFWFWGHPVVYFWLMPAYLLWYTVLPSISGGRLFSDPLARVVFVLFLLLSTPVGIHHQYVDPGIAEGFKLIAMTNTMFLLLPSLLTAFTVVASMEHGARQRGGSGLFGWLRALPWRNPAFTGMALAGLMFAAGGFSGMINAGMNINYLIHNTLWVPGHFHLTVGTAVALTFMAASYWLWPQLTNKPLFSRPIALTQTVVWFVGMALMSNAMHVMGLFGVPRRTAEPQYEGFEFVASFGSITELRMQLALGATLLFISTVLFVSNIALSTGSPTRTGLGQPLSKPLSPAADSPEVLDNLKLWFGIAMVLVVLAYMLPLASIVGDSGVIDRGVSAAPVMIDLLTGLNPVTAVTEAVSRLSVAIVGVVP